MNKEQTLTISLTNLVYHPYCVACTKPFTDGDIAVSVNKPFMCIIHSSCAPFFNWKGGWPHPFPLQAYEKPLTFNLGSITDNGF
jgi:hypothetical protein